MLHHWRETAGSRRAKGENILLFGFWPPAPTDSRTWPKVAKPPVPGISPERRAELLAINAEREAAIEAYLAEHSDPMWRILNPDEFDFVRDYLEDADDYQQHKRGHTCRVCKKRGTGFRVCERDEFYYPDSFLHYMVWHDVKPPERVIQAAMRAALPAWL